MARQNRTPIMEYARVGFGTGLGFFASLMLFTFVGLLFFVPGFIIVNREQAKEKPNNNMKIVGYVLMAIGVIVGLGFGASTFFSELGGEF